jgi:hypothetical protein
MVYTNLKKLACVIVDWLGVAQDDPINVLYETVHEPETTQKPRNFFDTS